MSSRYVDRHQLSREIDGSRRRGAADPLALGVERHGRDCVRPRHPVRFELPIVVVAWPCGWACESEQEVVLDPVDGTFGQVELHSLLAQLDDELEIDVAALLAHLADGRLQRALAGLDVTLGQTDFASRGATQHQHPVFVHDDAAGRHIGARAALAHRPWNFGSRFSMKALIASAVSAVPELTLCERASSSRAWSIEVASELLSIVFVMDNASGGPAANLAA